MKRDNLGPQYKTPKFQKVTMMDLSQTLSDKYENRKLEISKWYAIGDSITEKNAQHVKEHKGISFKLYVYFRHFIRKHPYSGPYPYDFTISAFTPVTSA